MARKLVFKRHAMRRMAARDIDESVVEIVFNCGEIVETYPGDMPYPSRLMLSVINARPIHIVVADNPSNDESYIITAYEPDPGEWDSSFKRRLSQ